MELVPYVKRPNHEKDFWPKVFVLSKLGYTTIVAVTGPDSDGIFPVIHCIKLTLCWEDSQELRTARKWIVLVRRPRPDWSVHATLTFTARGKLTSEQSALSSVRNTIGLRVTHRCDFRDCDLPWQGRVTKSSSSWERRPLTPACAHYDFRADRLHVIWMAGVTVKSLTPVFHGLLNFEK